MRKETLRWFIPLMIVLVLTAVCVVLLGTTDLMNTIVNFFDPALTVSIGSLDGLAGGERVQVEGYLHNRDQWIVLGYEYDCLNYFLSEERTEPHEVTVDLCIRLGHGLYDPLTELDGRRVRITGVLDFDESDQRPHVSLNHEEDIAAAP